MAELKILSLNVQSPPKRRAIELLSRLADEQSDVLVLSELSHSEGSLQLVDALRDFGYTCHWDKPEPGDYSALVAVRGWACKRANWEGGTGANRAVFVSLKIEQRSLVIAGLYVPSLNPKNMLRRADFFASMDGLMAALAARPHACVLVGGDLNCVPTWHQPMIPAFETEGYPFHALMKKHTMTDLNERLGPKHYSWWSPQGAGQLLDGFFIRDSFGPTVMTYALDNSFRVKGLTDHAGVRLSLQL